MNIYFACSITGGREFEPVYPAIVHALVEAGHQVPTAHLAESSVMAREAVISPNEVYSRDIGWIRNCDVLMRAVRTVWAMKSVLHWSMENLCWLYIRMDVRFQR